MNRIGLIFWELVPLSFHTCTADTLYFTSATSMSWLSWIIDLFHVQVVIFSGFVLVFERRVVVYRLVALSSFVGVLE